MRPKKGLRRTLREEVMYEARLEKGRETWVEKKRPVQQECSKGDSGRRGGEAREI